MTFSKLAILLLAFVLAACSTDSKKKKDIYLNSAKDFKQFGNFQVSDFKITKSNVASFNNYSFINRKTFNFKACVVDQMRAAITQPNLRFVIEDDIGNKEVVHTDSFGCVFWTETPSLDYLTEESYFKITRTIRSENYYKGYVIMEGYFNPWANDGAALLDPRQSKLPEGTSLQAVAPQMQGMRNAHYRSSANINVNLKSASFKFAGLDYSKYEVSPLLGLTVAHKYQVKLSPTVIRRTLEKTTVPETLNTGRMKAVLVILREDPNSLTQFTVKNVVTSVVFEDDLLYGDIMANITIPFPSIVDLTSRTVALISLIPNEELVGLPSMNFAGPLSPGQLSSLELKPVTHDAVLLHNQFQARLTAKRNASVNAVELFRKISGFRPVNVDVNVNRGWFAQGSSLKSMIEEFMANPKKGNKYSPNQQQLARTLCGQVYAGPGLDYYVSQCLRFPEAFIDLHVFTFAEKLNSHRPKPVGFTTVDTYKMATTFSYGNSTSTSVGTNFKVGASFPFEIPGLSFLKFSVGGDFATSNVYKKDRSSNVSASRERTVTAEGNSFEIDVMSRRCFVAGASERFLQTRKGYGIGVYYCEAQTRPERRIETYYLITNKTGVDGSPYSDNASAQSSPWKMMVRGTQTKNLFAELVEKDIYEVVLTKTDEMAALAQFKKLFPIQDSATEQFDDLYMTQKFPGLLSDPE